jgi:hypothetical protein
MLASVVELFYLMRFECNSDFLLVFYEDSDCGVEKGASNSKRFFMGK